MTPDEIIDRHMTDALRVGVRAEADKLIANPACYMGCHRIMHIVGSRIRALLDADTSTPDGTTTAETDGA